MTELLKLLGLKRTIQYLEIFKNRELKQFHQYPHYPTPETTGFYFSDEYEEGGGDYTSSIYVWVRGVRTSLHFKQDILEYVLAPTNSMVRL